MARADVFNMGGGQTSISLVPVGNPGNVADSAITAAWAAVRPRNWPGEVDYNYSIDAYDVTLAQYTQFLNAVAKTDTYGLYNSYMSTDYNTRVSSRLADPAATAIRSLARTRRPRTARRLT